MNSSRDMPSVSIILQALATTCKNRMLGKNDEGCFSDRFVLLASIAGEIGDCPIKI
nr:hypothetical protein [Candidatus Sigynarchaeota archaeon]